MNITVKPYDSELCYCRPDTTWEKEGRDFYVPDGVEKVLWTPVVFARISKAGKCVGAKFVSRYYDGFGIGALLYCSDEDLAFSSCLDHTSLLPMPLYNPVVLDNKENEYTLGELKGNLEGIKEALEDAICKASRRISLRIGDLVAVELDVQKVLAERSAGEIGFKAEFCGNPLFDLKMIF